jgi:hypothetical protein
MIKPTPGRLSELYDRWIGKRVRQKSTKLTGVVIGVDTRPMHPPLAADDVNGYVVIKLDKPALPTQLRAYAKEEDIEAL